MVKLGCWCLIIPVRTNTIKAPTSGFSATLQQNIMF